MNGKVSLGPEREAKLVVTRKDLLIRVHRGDEDGIAIELHANSARGSCFGKRGLGEGRRQRVGREDFVRKAQHRERRGKEDERGAIFDGEVTHASEEVAVLPAHQEVNVGAGEVEQKAASEAKAPRRRSRDHDLERHGGARLVGQIGDHIHGGEDAEIDQRPSASFEILRCEDVTGEHAERAPDDRLGKIPQSLEGDRSYPARSAGVDLERDVDRSRAEVDHRTRNDLGVGVAVIGERRSHALGRGFELLLIENIARSERDALVDTKNERARFSLEAPDRDRVNPHRLALLDENLDLDELAGGNDATRADLGVVIAAPLVVMPNALQVLGEHIRLEILVAPPRRPKEP